MSLMSKLLVTILTLSSLVYANDEQIINFFQNSANDPTVEISIIKKMDMQKPAGWKAYLIQFQKDTKGTQRSTFYIGDGLMATSLYDLKTGRAMQNPIEAEIVFEDKYYDAAHLLFGDADAEHKVVIFSDPLCPFCGTFVPEALSYMKKYPKLFAVYYYHFPLQQIHPASVPLVHAAIAAELQGRKNIISNLYTVKVHEKEPNLQKILDAFNKAQNSNLTIADISTKEVQDHLAYDINVAQELLVNGTPTVFFDGKKDPFKTKYKQVKINK